MAQIYKAPDNRARPWISDPGQGDFPKTEEEANNRWKALAEKVVDEAGEHPRRELNGAYHVLPKERFVTQQQDEEIVLLLRSHPIVNAGWILLVAAMMLAPSLLQATGLFAGVPGKFLFVGTMSWYLIVWAFAFERFLDWYYSIFLITNERIIDIDFYNLMSRVLTNVNLNHIEEPVMSQRGFGSTLFNYGNILVQTAGEEPTLEAKAVPRPAKVIDIVNRLSEELEKRRERGE